MSISSGRAGDIAETVASAYLMHKGYEVFCNQSSKGPIDLVAIDAEGNTHLYDVKRCNINSGRVYPKTSQSPSSKRLADTLGVRLLHVFISDSFQIIVEEDEDLLLEKVKGLGYKVRGQDITSSSWTYLYH